MEFKQLAKTKVANNIKATIIPPNIMEKKVIIRSYIILST